MKKLIAGAAVLVLAFTPVQPAAAAEVSVSLAASGGTFYPPVDGYRDVVRLTVRTDRQADVSLRIRKNRTSAVVKVIDLGTVAPGKHVTTWDGRDAGGEALPPGQYLVRASAERAGHPTQRSAYVPVRMASKLLAIQSSRHLVTPNTYSKVRGECGVLRQLAVPANAVQFDMDDPEDCAIGSSGQLETVYRFDDYPAGFRDKRRIINPHINVEALGNHPTGFGFLGVESFSDDEEIEDWEWSYDGTSGGDGVVEIDADIGFNQPTRRPVRYSFSASTGDDYVLYGFVIDLAWGRLVPAPPE